MEQFNPIVTEFFEGKPEFLKEIESFENRRKLNLLGKLKTDKDEINFFSWLAEVRFGLFFDKFCLNIENDYRIESKMPDWCITGNGQNFIAEVIRLNTPEKEYRASIERNRQTRKFQKENPDVPLIIQGKAKMISLEYLSGGQSKLVKKEERYRDIVQKYKMPFIICVAPTIDTYLFELDFYDFFMGSRGYFKRDENFGRNVTGILLNTPFNQFFYYHNEDAEYQLTKKTLNALWPFIYTS
jgi:hypothetical protein